MSESYSKHLYRVCLFVPAVMSTVATKPYVVTCTMRTHAAAGAVRREYVEAKLAAALHAHAGVAPADWRANGRLAGLAADKLGLCLAPPALPPRALSLGARPPLP